MRQRGFTLLELLVVMVIIGLLSAFVAPKVFGQIGKSETKIAKAQIEAIVKGLEQYRIDAGRYPSADQGLVALMVAPAGEAKWAGPYMAKALPQDPWGRSYLYRVPGGKEEDADVSNW